MSYAPSGSNRKDIYIYIFISKTGCVYYIGSITLPLMAVFAYQKMLLEILIITIFWNINCQDNYVLGRGIKITIFF
jgi:hypothetical protein